MSSSSSSTLFFFFFFVHHVLLLLLHLSLLPPPSSFLLPSILADLAPTLCALTLCFPNPIRSSTAASSSSSSIFIQHCLFCCSFVFVPLPPTFLLPLQGLGCRSNPLQNTHTDVFLPVFVSKQKIGCADAQAGSACPAPALRSPRPHLGDQARARKVPMRTENRFF